MFVASLGEETLQRSLATNISQAFDNCLLLLNLIRERTIGNPAATKGRTDNIKNLRTGLWSTLDIMLNQFAYELRLKVCEESWQQRNAALATNISQPFDNCLLLYIILFFRNNTWSG